MLQLKNVSFDHPSGKKTDHVLRRINLTLPSAGLILVTGDALSGKTTLLRLIAGREQPTRGEICVDRESTGRWSEERHSAWRRRVGYADETLLLPDRTVRENAELSAALAGWGVKDGRDNAAAALESLELTAAADKLPEELSATERKLAALCCALARGAEVLIVDEPTDALDYGRARQVIAMLRAASRDRLVVAASRSVTLLNGEQDRIITLQDGEIVSITGESEEGEHAPAATPAGISLGGRLRLCFQNLLTRRSRLTVRLLGVFCSVLAVCLALAAVDGARQRALTVQSETLAAYPITLTRESVASGDLEALGRYLEENMDIRSASLQKTYAITPRIYSYTAAGQVALVSPEAGTQANLWTELPDGEALKRARYQLVSGRWPARYDEAAVLLDSQGSLDRGCMSALGISAEQAAAGVSYTDLLRLSFRVVLPTGEYVPNVDGTWGYMGGDGEFMSAMVRSSQPLNVVGILRPVSGGAAAPGGAVYTADLTRWVVNSILTADIVRAQQADPTRDVLTLRAFDASAHVTGAEEQRAALRAYAAAMRPGEQAAFYERITGSAVEETMAQDSLMQLLATMEAGELAAVYDREIESAVSPSSLEANLTAFGVRDAQTLTGLRLYAGTFAYRGTAAKLLNAYGERVSYEDLSAPVISAGAALMESEAGLYPVLRLLAAVLGALGVILSSTLPLLPRRRELAVERALGMSAGRAAGVPGLENLLLSVLGSAAGALLVMALVSFAGGEPLAGAVWSLSWLRALITAVSAAALSTLSGTLFARAALSGSVGDALRRAQE